MALFKTYTGNRYDEIARIMANCFNEPISSVNFFLKNKSKNSKCYICKNKNSIISVLHGLPYSIKLGKNHFKISYIYAACTAPKYRKKGYMKKLIRLFEMQSKLNGFDFSVLVPDSKNLENYYQKLGYRNFFKIKKIKLNKEQFLNFCRMPKKVQNEQNKNIYKNFYKYMEKLRLDIYNNMDLVLYNAKDIEYAANLYRFFGGKLINIQQGYGICEPTGENTLLIKDFTCKNEFIPDLLEKIYKNFPRYENFEIQTSTADSFFENNATTHYFGMIKPLSKAGKIALEKFKQTSNQNAYLGLALD